MILSPGPGHPSDAGCFTGAARAPPASTPVLGVCLGHQALGSSQGGMVDRADPVHGKASLVFHEGRGILDGVTRPVRGGAVPLAGGASATTSPTNWSSRRGPRTAW